MAFKLKDLPPEVQRKVKGKAKVRMRQDEITRHALAIAALLLDERNLSASEARRVLNKAISLVR